MLKFSDFPCLILNNSCLIVKFSRKTPTFHRNFTSANVSTSWKMQSLFTCRWNACKSKVIVDSCLFVEYIGPCFLESAENVQHNMTFSLTWLSRIFFQLNWPEGSSEFFWSPFVRFSLFTFLSSSPEPLGKFQQNLSLSILWWRLFNFLQMKGQGKIITK